MKTEQREGKIINLKPEMTTGMKLAASFALTYYVLLLAFAITALIFSEYYIDAYYSGARTKAQDPSALWLPILQLVVLAVLVFSLIQILRKKIHGKAIFLAASIVLIILQLIGTGLVPWMKYALELLLVLIITPIRVKKETKVKEGQMEIETVEDSSSAAPSNPSKNAPTGNREG